MQIKTVTIFEKVADILQAVDNAKGMRKQIVSYEELFELQRALEEFEGKGSRSGFFSFFGRGDVRDVSDAIILKDGSYIVCVTLAQFVDTFASHDNITVAWAQVWTKGAR